MESTNFVANLEASMNPIAVDLMGSTAYNGALGMEEKNGSLINPVA